MRLEVLVFIISLRYSQCHDSDALGSGVNDVIAVKQTDGTIKSTPFYVQIGRFENTVTQLFVRKGKSLTLYVNDIKVPVKMILSDGGFGSFKRPNQNFSLTNEEWSQVQIKAGKNAAYFDSEYFGIQLHFDIFLYDQDTKLIVTDVDGTITTSNFLGRLLPLFSIKYHQKGVVNLFESLSKKGYTIVYLTARSFAEDQTTKQYLFQDLQNVDGASLPEGPVFMSPTSLDNVVVNYLLRSRDWIKKLKTLQQICELFNVGCDVIQGAYGNSVTDRIAYEDAGIKPEKIFNVDPEGRLTSIADPDTISSYSEQLENISTLYP